MNKKNILTFILIFLVLNFVVSFFTNKTDNSTTAAPASDFTVTTTKTEYGLHDLVGVKIKNNTANAATIKNKCPANPLEVSAYVNGQWIPKTSAPEIKCDKTQDTVIDAGKEVTVSYTSWNNALFNELGRYKISAQIISGNTAETIKTVTLETGEFEIKPQGWLGIAWTSALFQPIYNILILLISFIPYHDLGFAIILLTIIIRTILLVPSQKALKSQRKLQEIQPKLNKLREKYKDNKEMLAKETMAIWKENKVNPFGSCLPLLIQFPVLIALFYVIQSGLHPDNAYLLYAPLKDFSLANINVNFLGFLDLTAINAFALPLFVGALQFLQMKLAVIKSDKAKAEKQGDEKPKKNETDMANQMMVYFMPVMIAIFTASVPAGVGLYWSVSTLYGIVQQLIVNKQVSGEKATVRVINQ
jgi:YidC/Oxa1 family membrane protein insertase